MKAADYITHFNLLPHPEGGHYAETYRSSESIPKSGLPSRFTGGRSFSTAIYFLLNANEFSAFHRIKADECWHFYAGGPLLIHIISPNGNYEVVTLGADISKGMVFQFVVPANSWFASQPAEGSAFSLVGCTVAPGFDFEDFEMANQNELSNAYPQHQAVISALCR
jgi:uncharacterized protein